MVLPIKTQENLIPERAVAREIVRNGWPGVHSYCMVSIRIKSNGIEGLRPIIKLVFSLSMGASMSDVKVMSVNTRDEIDRFHFIVGLIVLLTATAFTAFVLQFLTSR
jgi:hypothetical protein